jgi:hypothetical protein
VGVGCEAASTAQQARKDRQSIDRHVELTATTFGVPWSLYEWSNRPTVRCNDFSFGSYEPVSGRALPRDDKARYAYECGRVPSRADVAAGDGLRLGFRHRFGSDGSDHYIVGHVGPGLSIRSDDPTVQVQRSADGAVVLIWRGPTPEYLPARLRGSDITCELDATDRDGPIAYCPQPRAT